MNFHLAAIGAQADYVRAARLVGCPDGRALRKGWLHSGWRDVAERRVRPALTVVGDSAGDRRARMIEAEEEALVEKLVAYPAVETITETVLHWLPGRDEMTDDAVVQRPAEHGARDELGPVVGNENARPAASLDQGRHFARNAPAGD